MIKVKLIEYGRSYGKKGRNQNQFFCWLVVWLPDYCREHKNESRYALEGPDCKV